MSTTSHTAAAIMDRSALLLNDPSKTDYTYGVQIGYLNMAIEELNGLLEEANMPINNKMSVIYPIPPGSHNIMDPPADMVEIQECGERLLSPLITSPLVPPFRPLPRKEFVETYPATDSLLFYCWMNNRIEFNRNGPTVPMEIQLKYICLGIQLVRDPEAIIGSIHSISFLSYKVASLLARFVGENPARADILQMEADMALDRIVAISNKGRQQIMTRHRPFRASYKARGY